MNPPFFEYQNAVKILCGDHALDRIPDELRHLDAAHPLLLTDAMLMKLGIATIVAELMSEEGCPAAATFTDIPVDSSLSVVNRIASLFREHACDSIVAVGGGSVIDSAKGVRLVLSQETDDILSLSGVENLVRGRHVPFIVVPTTAGTGSECTGVAVIRNEAQDVKMEFLSPFVEPDVAILDARMTLKLPARATASTGMDALCHAIEAASCLQKNPLSDAHATAAISLVSRYLLRAVEAPSDADARLHMALAATLAGIAFSNSMVGGVHAIGHALGGVCHVPHADVMAILLPHVMRYNLSKADRSYAELLPYMIGMEAAAALPREQRAQALLDSVVGLTQKLHDAAGLHLRLRDLGVPEQELEHVAEVALNDGALIVNPVALDKERTLQLLRAAY